GRAGAAGGLAAASVRPPVGAAAGALVADRLPGAEVEQRGIILLNLHVGLVFVCKTTEVCSGCLVVAQDAVVPPQPARDEQVRLGPVDPKKGGRQGECRDREIEPCCFGKRTSFSLKHDSSSKLLDEKFAHGHGNRLPTGSEVPRGPGKSHRRCRARRPQYR